MVKTASGEKTTARGSNESQRAAAQSLSVPFSKASKDCVAAVQSPSGPRASNTAPGNESGEEPGTKLGARRQSLVVSAVSAGQTRAVKAVGPPGKKTLGQLTGRAGSISGQSGSADEAEKAGSSAGKQASATEAAASASRKRVTKQESKQARMPL
jgi:RNA polymerase primary sigma factor